MVVVMDAEGVTHDCFFWARSRRRARRAARLWMAHVEWATTIVAVTPMVGSRERPTRRRLLAVGVVTFAVAAPIITAAMIIGWRVEGAI
jgi:hypothetical protein